MKPTIGRISEAQAKKINPKFVKGVIDGGYKYCHNFDFAVGCMEHTFKRGQLALTFDAFHEGGAGFFVVKITKVSIDAIGEPMIRGADNEFSWRISSCAPISA